MSRPIVDQEDPLSVARFLIFLGYAPEKVVNTLIERCKLSDSEARDTVASATAIADQKRASEREEVRAEQGGK